MFNFFVPVGVGFPVLVNKKQDTWGVGEGGREYGGVNGHGKK